MEKQDLIYWTRRLYEKGLSPSTSGNVSMLSDDNNILITASGSAAGDIWMDDIVKMDFEGNLIEGVKNPSSEKLMHLEIYRKRKDLRAIIHSHSPEITAFAVAGLSISDTIMPEFAYYFGYVPLAKYAPPSSYELAKNVGEKFEEKNAVLMENHGIAVGGKNLKEAFYLLETIQSYCKTYLFGKILGKMQTLSKKDIEEIRK